MIKIEDLRNDKNYHGFAHTLSESDERIPHFLEQREKNGFDDTETWSLYNTIVSFTLPRLKHFREVLAGYPGGMTQDEWEEILDKMIYSFQMIEDDKIIGISKEENDKLNEGLDLFREYIFQLWW